MANNGVANQGPVRNAQVGGTPGGTGQAPAPPPAGPDLSARARIECEEGSLEGFFPEEARSDDVRTGRVTLTVTIDSDGAIVTARASSDPGHGFARAAERAIRSGACTGTPAKNREGQNVRATIPFTLNFVDS